MPKKLLVYASQFQDEFESAAGFGWTVGKSTFNWSRLIANKNRDRAGATKAVFDSTIGIHPTAAEEFVTLRETNSKL